MAPCPLCCARMTGRGSPVDSSVLGIGLCSATGWGGDDSSCPTSSARARERAALHSLRGGGCGPAVIARGAADRAGHHGAACPPRALGAPAQAVLQVGAGPGQDKSCASAGVEQSRPPALGGTHPEVKVSVRAGALGRRVGRGWPPHSSMASSWSARSSNMLPMSSRMLPVLFTASGGRGPCPSSCRIFSSTACSAAARHALVSSSFCRALSPGEVLSGAAGAPAAAAAAAAARGGLAGTCIAGVPGDGGLAGLVLSEGGVPASLARAAGDWRAGEGAGDGLALPDCSPAAALAGLGAVGGGGGLGDTGGGVPCARFTSGLPGPGRGTFLEEGVGEPWILGTG